MPAASVREEIWKEPPPRRCGGGLDLRYMCSAVNERGRHPLGGTGAASAAQGLGGITSAAGLETSVRAVLSIRLAEGCASIFCPHLCRHTVFSAQTHSNRSHERSKEQRTQRDRPVTSAARASGRVLVGQATQPMNAIAKERPENHDRSDRSRTRGDQALPPEPRIRRPSRRRSFPL